MLGRSRVLECPDVPPRCNIRVVARVEEEMELVPPECSDEKLTPSSSKDRVQCDKCYKLVCEVHDELFQVFQQRCGEYGRSDMICGACLEFGRSQAEISSGEDYEYTS
jgi:hypothetical protein